MAIIKTSTIIEGVSSKERSIVENVSTDNNTVYIENVTSGNNTVHIENVVTGDNTIVEKVLVGTPVRRVVGNQNNINDLNGVYTENKLDGSVLIYNANTNLWESSNDLEKQNINGGQY